jgi:hypothetical protein
MDSLSIVWDLVSNPTIGLPVVLLVAASAVWSLRGVPPGRLTVGFEPRIPDPDRDPVSRTFVALRRHAYSEVVRQVYERLDRALIVRCHLALAEVPWRRSVARRLGVPDPKGLEQSRIALDSLHLWAARLETNSLFRRDFWRSPEASRQAFLRRLAKRLAIVDAQLRTLTSPP